MMSNNPIINNCCLMLLALFVLTACNQTLRPTSLATSDEAAARTWPDPPAEPRYIFVKEFSGPENLGIKKSFWRKLAGLIVGTVKQNMIRPMAVVTTDDGELIYVADPGVQGIHRFDLQRGSYRLLRLDQNMPLPSPVGMAISSSGKVFITDSQLGRLLTIEPKSDHLQLMDTGTALSQPTGIIFDDDSQHIFVVDTADHNIKEFSSTGDLINEFSQRGNAPGDLNYPTYLWQNTQNQLLIADSLNFRVQIFDTNGSLSGGFGKIGDGSGSLSRPKGVATDSYGHIYIVDSMFHALQIFDASGALLLSLGTQGQGPGEFWLPNGLFVDADNLIYVADSHNQRIQVFKYVGDTP